MRDSEIQAAYLPGERGRIFAVLRKPGQPSRGAVLIAPPFAEEMNKTRHLLTEVAVQLAAMGYASVLADLFGTGDSEGEFAQADWRVWKADLAAAAAWCEAQSCAVTSILAVRLGCALASELVREREWRIKHAVFWQPVLSGGRALDQFLRLRVAATMMQQDGKETIAGLRERLNGGETLEVAGYDVSGKLSQQLDAVDLASALCPELGSVHWVEVVRSSDAAPPTPVQGAVQRARASGISIELCAIQGEPFWSTVELVRNPALVAETVRVLGAHA